MGVKGEKGIKGQQGVKGHKGQKGVEGQKGQMGQKGEEGQKGMMGLKGTKGIKGEKGQQGVKGEKGTKGIKGMQVNMKCKILNLKYLMLPVLQPYPLTIGPESDRAVCGPIFPLERRYFCTVLDRVCVLHFILLSNNSPHVIFCLRKPGVTPKRIVKRMI